MRIFFHQNIAALIAYHRNLSGATAIEYTLIVAGVALAIVATVFVFGESVLALFQEVQAAFDANL